MSLIGRYDILLRASGSGTGSIGLRKLLVAAHTQALERVLGVPSGSIELVDTAKLRAWLREE